MPQPVDILLTNAHVLSMDEQLTQYDPGALAVRGDSIVAVGPEAEIKKEYAAKETFDCGGKILMPGLINAHTHVPMTLLRGLADDLRLDVWLQGYMWPVEREFVSPEFVRLGTQIACAEFIRSGVTTFNDMYFFEEEVAQATAEAGLRAVCGQSVLKFPTSDAPSYEDAMARARGFIQTWKGHELIVPAIAPHAPYTTTADMLRETAELAKEFDVPLHIHLAETSFEVENMREEQGMPVIPYVKKQGLFEAKVIAAHCVHIDPGEIRTLKNHDAGVAHNPSSNLKLASGFAPVTKMLEAGLNVGIGTDGPASNNNLDLLRGESRQQRPDLRPRADRADDGHPPRRAGASSRTFNRVAHPRPPRRPDRGGPVPRPQLAALPPRPQQCLRANRLRRQIRGCQRRDGQRQMADARPPTADPQRRRIARPGQ